MSEKTPINNNVLTILDEINNRISILEERVATVYDACTKQTETLRRDSQEMFVSQKAEMVKIYEDLEKEKKDRRERRLRALEKLK
jgi:hypothetical protein